MRIGPGRPCFGLDDHGGTANSVANAHCNDTSIFGLLDCKPPLGFDCSRVGRWWPWRCFRGRGSWRRVAAVPAAMPLLHSNHFTNTSGRTPSFCLRRMYVRGRSCGSVSGSAISSFAKPQGITSSLSWRSQLVRCFGRTGSSTRNSLMPSIKSRIGDDTWKII
jgi:hypothetical protein